MPKTLWLVITESSFNFFQDSDDEWVFDPDIDAILEAYGQKRKRDEAFSEDDDDVSD